MFVHLLLCAGGPAVGEAEDGGWFVSRRSSSQAGDGVHSTAVPASMHAGVTQEPSSPLGGGGRSQQLSQGESSRQMTHGRQEQQQQHQRQQRQQLLKQRQQQLMMMDSMSIELSSPDSACGASPPQLRRSSVGKAAAEAAESDAAELHGRGGHISSSVDELPGKYPTTGTVNTELQQPAEQQLPQVQQQQAQLVLPVLPDGSNNTSQQRRSRLHRAGHPDDDVLGDAGH